MKLTQARLYVLAYLAQHGCQFERDFTTPTVAKVLAEAGLIERSPGWKRGSPTVVQVSQAGRIAAIGRLCGCFKCSQARLSIVH
jgi:hypothetical protein